MELLGMGLFWAVFGRFSGLLGDSFGGSAFGGPEMGGGVVGVGVVVADGESTVNGGF
jgi:hypothetical protein